MTFNMYYLYNLMYQDIKPSKKNGIKENKFINIKKNNVSSNFMIYQWPWIL